MLRPRIKIKNIYTGNKKTRLNLAAKVEIPFIEYMINGMKYNTGSVEYPEENISVKLKFFKKLNTLNEKEI